MDDITAYLLPMLIFFTLCTAFGIIGNFIMVFITIIRKSLHSPCHILISLICLFDLLHQIGHIPFLYGLYTGKQWTQQQTCFYIQLIPMYGLLTGGTLLLSLGIDRLIAVLSPSFYRMNQQRKGYIPIHLFLPTIYYALLVYYASLFRNERPSMCSIPEFFDGPSNNHWALASVIINILILIIYLIVFLKLKSSKFIIFVAFGWFTTMAINYVSTVIGATGDTLFLIQAYAGIPVNCALSANFPVYYCISSEHKSAIRQLFCGDGKGGNSAEFVTTTESTVRRGTISSISPSSNLQNINQPRRQSVCPTK